MEMKSYIHDYSLPIGVEALILEALGKANPEVTDYLERAKQMLTTYLSQMNLIECEEPMEGYVPAREALDDSLKNRVDFMVRMTKATNAAVTEFAVKRKDGYVMKLSLRKDGSYTDDEFKPEQIALIRQLLKERIAERKGADKEELDELLETLNVCQEQLQCEPYETVDSLLKNTTGNWNKPKEIQEEEFDDNSEDDE